MATAKITKVVNGKRVTVGYAAPAKAAASSVAPVAASSVKNPQVTALNEARAAAKAAGQDVYGGNLKDLATFTGAQVTPSPIVATTSPDRAGFVNNSTKLDEIMNGKNGVGSTVVPGDTSQEMGGTDNSKSKGNPGTKPQPDEEPSKLDGLADPTKLAIAELEDQEKRRKQTYQALKKVNDATYNQSIDELDTTYSSLREKADESSKRYLGTLNQAAYAGDAFRYTPQITAGTIYNAEQEGIKKLQDIDREENSLIAKARLARDTNNFSALQSYMDDLDSIGEKRVNVLTEQYDAAKELQDKIDEQEMTASRDDAVAGLVAQGVTDPSQILDYLNYDDEGKKVGDFSLKQVSEALGYLKAPDLGGMSFKFDDKQTAKLLGAGLSMTDIQNIRADLSSGASLDEVFGEGSGFTPAEKTSVQSALGIDPTAVVVPGKGATSTVDEQIIRSRLFNYVKDVLNRGAVSDSDAARINTAIDTFRNAGMGEQEILDELSGFPSGVVSPYNQSFRDAVVINSDTADQKSTRMQKLSTLLAGSNYIGAMTAIENDAMEKAKKIDPDGYMGQTTANRYLSQIDAIRTILADAGFVGPVEGSYQKVLGKFKKADAVKLEAAVAAMTAQFRNDISGSAVTDSEQKFLEPLIPGLTDSKANFAEKLNALQNKTLLELNATRQNVGLPRVDYRQAIRPADRLQVYSSDTSSGIVGPKNTSAGGAATLDL